MKTIIKLLKCKTCQKFPYFERDFKNNEWKIWCSHKIFTNEKKHIIAEQWNFYNQKLEGET